jgi:hypothetical protein
MKMFNAWFAAAFKLYQGQTIVKAYAPWPNPVHSVARTLTLAEVTAAHTTPINLVPALPGLKMKVLRFTLVPSGTFNNFTSAVLQDGAGTPVVAATIPIAVVNGAITTPDTANVTLGAGFLVPLTVKTALQFKTTGGTAASTGTSLTVHVLYTTEE